MHSQSGGNSSTTGGATSTGEGLAACQKSIEELTAQIDKLRQEGEIVPLYPQTHTGRSSAGPSAAKEMPEDRKPKQLNRRRKRSRKKDTAFEI